VRPAAAAVKLPKTGVPHREGAVALPPKRPITAPRPTFTTQSSISATQRWNDVGSGHSNARQTSAIRQSSVRTNTATTSHTKKSLSHSRLRGACDGGVLPSTGTKSTGQGPVGCWMMEDAMLMTFAAVPWALTKRETPRGWLLGGWLVMGSSQLSDGSASGDISQSHRED
jgi:hypothetical protein